LRFVAPDDLAGAHAAASEQRTTDLAASESRPASVVDARRAAELAHTTTDTSRSRPR